MDSPDRSAAANSLVTILRKVTRGVQLLPFAYLCFYALYLLLGYLVPDRVLGIADTFLALSPVVTLVLLAASKLLKLCAWHKAACLIPLSSRVINFIDINYFTFTQEESVIINSLIGAGTVLFLVAAYIHFFHHGR